MARSKWTFGRQRRTEGVWEKEEEGGMGMLARSLRIGLNGSRFELILQPLFTEKEGGGLMRVRARVIHFPALLIRSCQT